MRPIGLHLRFIDCLQSVIDKAIRLQLPIFQCFLQHQDPKKAAPLSPEDQEYFLQFRRDRFAHVYAHVSYRANLCMPDNSGLLALKKELALARRLEFTHAIIHPGSAKLIADKKIGIARLAQRLNSIAKLFPDISLVLENTAHGNFSIGSDLTDFQQLRTYLDRPESIKFCIDTAHAYSFGYNITDDVAQDAFIDLIGQTMGFDAVALIHLNDTDQQLGKRIDRHVVIGQGNIGEQALRRFIEHENLKHVPVIMESPRMEESIEQQLYERIKEWQIGVI